MGLNAGGIAAGVSVTLSNAGERAGDEDLMIFDDMGLSVHDPGECDRALRCPGACPRRSPESDRSSGQSPASFLRRREAVALPSIRVLQRLGINPYISAAMSRFIPPDIIDVRCPSALSAPAATARGD